jgi:type I restriction enzyme S subunit
MTDLSKAGDTLGFPAFVPRFNGMVFHHNQRLGKVILKQTAKFKHEFIYRVLCQSSYRNYIAATATGTTVKHTSPSKILKYRVLHSGGVIESIYESFSKLIASKKDLNNLNNLELRKLRDTLLPKLISGEISVDQVTVE